MTTYSFLSVLAVLAVLIGLMSYAFVFTPTRKVKAKRKAVSQALHDESALRVESWREQLARRESEKAMTAKRKAERKAKANLEYTF